MKPIFLPSGELVLVDAEDYGRVTAHKWFVSKNDRGHAYATATIDGKWTGMHRFILGAEKGGMVDHRNGCGLDNRKANLRASSSGQNRANSGSNRAMPKGVYARRQRSGGVVYRAQIRHDKHLTNLGTYPTISEAAAAYALAAPKFHGEFARTEN